MHWQRVGAGLNNGGIQAGGTQRGRHSVGRCGISRRSREDSSKSESYLEFSIWNRRVVSTLNGPFGVGERLDQG